VDMVGSFGGTNLLTQLCCFDMNNCGRYILIFSTICGLLVVLRFRVAMYMISFCLCDC
jgi:hypothetical protein